MNKRIRYFSGTRLSEVLARLTKLNSGLNIPAFEESKPVAVATDIQGFRFDFNFGLRLLIPAGDWHVTVLDSASNLVVFDENVSDVLLISLEKFLVRWEFTLSRNGEVVFRHRYNPRGRKVHFNFGPSGMGDRFVLFQYMEVFRKKYDCIATCKVEPYLQEIVKLYHRGVECVDETPADSYAAYFLSPTFSALISSDTITKIPMLTMGEGELGLKLRSKLIYRPTKPRQISEPYVCIGVQASTTIKAWLNPHGWDIVVAYLKYLGYRVLCIDKNREQTDHGFTVRMPENAEDFTGDLPLSERVNLLAYADFFIGLSSGLAWLAWAVDIPVIMIGGITASYFEFPIAYRVINRLVCHACHNDTTIKWPEFENCPGYKRTPRAYECSKRISAQQVIDAIDELMTDNALK